MMRVLVTGANGHIGSNTIRSLLVRGHEVVPLVRQGADMRGLEGLELECRFGDALDAGSLASAAQGCDAIVHTAAVYKMWARDHAEIIGPALAGARSVLEATRRSGARRVVYTSSAAAIGYSYSPDAVRTESDWIEDARNPYFVAKAQSEREAVRLAESFGVELVRLCPTVVVGPYDYRITPSTQIVLDLVNRRTTTWQGGLNIVDVRDVADVHAAAVEAGEPRARYIVGGTNLHSREIGGIIRGLTGVAPRHMGAGRTLSLLFAGAVELGARIFGSQPFIDRSTVHEIVGRYGYFDSSAAEQTFGLRPRGVEEAIRDCIRWLLHIGKIKPSVAQSMPESLGPDPGW